MARPFPGLWPWASGSGLICEMEEQRILVAVAGAARAGAAQGPELQVPPALSPLAQVGAGSPGLRT